MKAVCWFGKHDVRVENVPDPKILNSRDAIVRVTSTAICGSDLHLYNAFVPSMQPGDILGHEFMGEVVEVGPEVKQTKVGDRVVVAFPIACGQCFACAEQLYSLCENSNPNAGLAEKLMGHAPCGIFGYSHMLGGFAGGQAEYVRVPFADVGTIKIPENLSDEKVLFLSDIFPTGYMAAEMCNIKPSDTIAVWGCGPVGIFAMASARSLGAARIIAIDRFDYRLEMARDKIGAIVIDYEQNDVYQVLMELTGGRGPDACIDAVGMEAHKPGVLFAIDNTMQAIGMETDRPLALREAIYCCKNGGTVSIIGVYGGFIDKFPIGSLMNRSLTVRTGQCHVQRYMSRLLQMIEREEIDPSMVISHRMNLADAPKAYDLFLHKTDNCEKIVLSTAA